jgi:hypothetical protein
MISCGSVQQIIVSLETTSVKGRGYLLQAEKNEPFLFLFYFLGAWGAKVTPGAVGCRETLFLRGYM